MPILATKLYIPQPRPKVVLRPHLSERLNEGLSPGRKLTLVSAAAGFGKTTLLSEWVAGGRRPVAWLSLDEGDNDPTRFLAYLIAALQTLTLAEGEGLSAKIGAGILGMLESPQPPPTEALLTALLNEIAAVPEHFLLVLDDYHVIEAQAVDQMLVFLVEHLPPSMHLVIATREDPQLPLARLRARGQLTELRAADLRFAPAEAAQFLNQVMGLNLAAADITALEARTEGWIAGLQMAALSLQGRADTASFIRAFTGSHRFVLDYLVEEVLQRQPERIRSFLLQTAILDRLSGPLCDAVTGQTDGREILEILERGNLFVVPLDDQRQWLRYHHLFAEVLQARLLEAQPGQASTLHRRASAWYERNGLPSDAIRHALAAQDFEGSARLIELEVGMMRAGNQEATWKVWVQALPAELVSVRPVLSVYYAFCLLPGDLDAAEARLQDAERWLDPAAEMSERPQALLAETRPERSRRRVVANEEEFRSVPGTIAVARAYRAGALGDLPGTLKYARQALDLLPASDQFWRGAADALLGIAYWTSGELEAAHRSIADGMANARLVSGISATVSFTYLLADIRIAQGRLREAARTCQQALRLVAEQGEPVPQGTAELHVLLSEVHLERNDLEAATECLLRSKELGAYAVIPEGQHRWHVAKARLTATQGNLDGALELLDRAERLYLGGPTPEHRPITALKALVWVEQGRVAEALDWAREQGLSADDDLSYLREFEHIALAKALLAAYGSTRVESSLEEVMGFLERLLHAAEAGGRKGHAIAILSLQALALAAQGDTSLALAPLARALALAEPEGFVRVFVDEGPPMAALLHEAAEHGIAPKFVGQLRAAFGQADGKTPMTQPLIEPLSDREIEVLRLLDTELSGPEIARKLMVSLNTLHTHTKRIYGKLGVNNRRAAVRRAETLDLL